LAAAHHLERLADLEIHLYEASDRLGGKLQTERFAGLVIEEGPDCFFSRKAGALELICELGLESELIQPRRRAFYMCIDGGLHRVPRGLISSQFTDAAAISEATFLSSEGKQQALAEVHAPVAKTNDESIRSFFSRRFGREFTQSVIEPLLAGTHGGAADELGMQALYPGYLAIERRHGSITAAQAALPQAGSEPKPTFLSFRGGMRDLVAGLERSLRRTRVHLETQVESLEEISADWYFLAVPANVAAKIAPEPARPGLSSIPHRSSSIVTLAYPRSAVAHPLDGTGFLVPAGQGLSITGMTWSSQKWPSRAPRDQALLRVFMGSASGTSEDMIDTAIREIRPLIGISGDPLMTRFTRWSDALPQYRVGHLSLIDEIESLLPQNVYLLGTSYRGVGIPDCLGQARAAAEKLAGNI
jgi:oxygen-dependent protoporphyrinogen oxidase